jgi:hypothetical protein
MSVDKVKSFALYGEDITRNYPVSDFRITDQDIE